MNTPTHLLIGVAVFGRAHKPALTVAALLGALAPDVSLYLMIFWAVYLQGKSHHEVFDQLYFTDRWQAVFAVDNSFILWGMALAIALWRRWPLAVAFTGAAFMHLLCDFPLHGEDARRHFWPLSNWVFDSPVSYWDRRRYGDIVGVAELAIALVTIALLWRRHNVIWARLALGVALFGILAPFQLWAHLLSAGVPH